MNLLKNTILKIISVKDVSPQEAYGEYYDEKRHKEDNYKEVIMEVNCYGQIRTITDLYTVEDWKLIEKQGYFMG